MKGIACWVACSSALLFTFVASGFCRNKQDAALQRDVRSTGGAETTELPFKLMDNYLIVVEGRIGAQEHLKFALDTGATFSAVRASLAKPEFVRRALRTVSLDQVLKLEAAEVPDLQLGPIKLSRLPMMLSNFTYLGATGASVDAVIGLDVLKSQSLTIDFAHRKLRFAEGPQLRSSVPLEISDAYVSVEVRVQSRPLRLLLDSGVPTILLYRERLLDRMPRIDVVRTIVGNGLSGPAPLDLITMPRTQLGRYDLDRRAAIAEKPPAGLLPGIDGYLALVALHTDRCSISFEQKIFSWQ